MSKKQATKTNESFDKYSNVDYNDYYEKIKTELQGGSKDRDQRFFKVSKDKETGQGYALVRLLPNKNPTSVPFKLIQKHSFTIGNNTFWSDCGKTFGRSCPICNWNRKQDKDWVKKNKTYSKKKYVGNVLVIEDANKDNIGKVLLFEWGKQLMGVINEKLSPTSKKKAPLPVFNIMKGANLELQVTKGDGGYATWKTSDFLDASPITEVIADLGIDGDDMINSLHDLDMIINELGEKSESFDDLEARFNQFLVEVDLMEGSAKPVTPSYKPKTAAEPQAARNVVLPPDEDGEGDADPEDETPPTKPAPKAAAGKGDGKSRFASYVEDLDS